MKPHDCKARVSVVSSGGSELDTKSIGGEMTTGFISEEWAKLAQELNERGSEAVFHLANPFKGLPYPEVTVTVNGWQLKLGASDVHGGLKFTTVSGPFTAPGGFPFSLRGGAWISFFEKPFAKRDIKIGDKEFDDKAWIQSKEPEKIKAVLANAELRRTILETETFWLAMDYEATSDSYGCGFVETGVDVTIDRQRLHKILNVVAATMTACKEFGGGTTI